MQTCCAPLGEETEYNGMTQRIGGGAKSADGLGMQLCESLDRVIPDRGIQREEFLIKQYRIQESQTRRSRRKRAESVVTSFSPAS